MTVEGMVTALGLALVLVVGVAVWRGVVWRRRVAETDGVRLGEMSTHLRQRWTGSGANRWEKGELGVDEG